MPDIGEQIALLEMHIDELEVKLDKEREIRRSVTINLRKEFDTKLWAMGLFLLIVTLVNLIVCMN